MAVGGALVVGAAATARAQPLVPVFGVDLGAPAWAVEQAAGAAGSTCHRSTTAPGHALVCTGSLVRLPLATVTTYWIRDGRVDQIYQQAQVDLPFFSQYLGVLQLWRARIEAALGQAGALEGEPLPDWAQSLTESQRRQALAEGRLRVRARWFLPGSELALTLHGQQGRPVLVLAATPRPGEPAPAPAEPVARPCTPDDLMSALATLFPPADPGQRAAGARTLARCRDPRTLGPLRAVLRHDPEVAVRTESLRALAAVGDAEPVRATLFASSSPDVVRAAALEALADAGSAPAPEELPALGDGAGPALAAALERMKARAGATSDRPLPPTPEGAIPGAVAQASEPLPVAPLAVVRPPAPVETVRIPAPPPPPPKPWVDRDGSALAITTSIAAGGVWGSGLSLLAQQNGVGVVTLLGSAGAVIGGGTAWGLTRFGLRPTAAQALWFSNSTAWGALAGLTVWSGSGSDSPKLKYGLLVGGETAGIVAGAWSARRFPFTPEKTVFADSLVLGAGLGVLGGSMLWNSDSPFEVPAAAAIGVVPALLGAAVVSQVAQVSKADLPLLAAAPVAAGWTGALLTSGWWRAPLFSAPRGLGGATLGLGAGYLGAAAAASFVDVPVPRLVLTASGLLAGNLLGAGVHMVADPEGRGRWSLGAGLGGVALAGAAYAAAPHLHPGPSAAGMTIAGTLYGSGVWALALNAASTGQPPDARVPGGMLAGGVSAGIAGLLASQWFEPEPYHQGVAALGTLTGMSAGLGLAKLTTGNKGVPELAGVIGGAAAGFTGGVVVSRGPRLRPPALLAGALGASYGLMVGTLLPTLPDDQWSAGRKTAGAGWLGLSLGAAGAALGARAVDADAGQVVVVSSAGVLGLGMGIGAGWMLPDGGSRAPRIGVLAGSGVMLAAGALAEHTWQLSDTLGAEALPLGLFGAVIGAAHGYLVGRVVAPDDRRERTSLQIGGATLLGASAGIATGVLASRWLHPTGNDYLGMTGASVLGHWAGQGVAELTRGQNEDTWYPGYMPPAPGRREPLLRLAGALTGLGAGALVARKAPLRSPDLLAGLTGTGYGAILGTLAPSLHRDDYIGGNRGASGAHLGAAFGGAAGAAAAHLTDASSSQVLVPSVFTGLGGLAGLGLGHLLPGERSQDWRVASFGGMLAFAGASIALDRPLRLSEGFSVPRSFALSGLGLAVGSLEGGLLAHLVDRSGPGGETGTDATIGGALLGDVLGASTGFVLARFIQPSLHDSAVSLGGLAAGAGLGVGLAKWTTATPGRADTAGALAGSLLGLGGLALTQRESPLQNPDYFALVVGTGFGGMFGRLLPTLGQPQLGGLDRTGEGGLLTGLSGGALAAVAARHLTDASPQTVGLATLGGADGLLTGLGLGLLLDGPGQSRGQRIGAVAGAAAGLGIGAGLWPQLDWQGTDATLVGSLTALGAWNGLLAPGLGHARFDVSGRQTSGGFLVGGGAGSLLATALVPALDLDPDLIGDALAMDLVLTGAGAGTGALISGRYDASVWGALAGGAGGLVLGGALHRSIELSDRRLPLLHLSTLEGLWFGGWLPFALRAREQVTARQVIGGLAAGGLGGAALATLAGSVLQPDGREAGTVALTTAIGTSLAGGSALIADSLPGQGRVALLLGGSGAGLVAGALGARSIDLTAGAGYASMGSLLGASEGLVFAWAGRADGGADYGGAGLVGAGLGSTMGLVVASNPRWMQGRGLPAAGFAGWGAWMGAFGGSLINRDPHEVTLGGLAGANAGLLAGLGLLATGAVEPRDFGWLSAFGAAGTVLGGGVGALVSSRTDPRPALAGLLLGPAVGLATGALVLPHLPGIGRASKPSPIATAASSTSAAVTPSTAAPAPGSHAPIAVRPANDASAPSRPAGHLLSSPELWEATRSRERTPSLATRVRRSFGVSHLMPVIGAPPPTDPAAGPPPFVLGVAGLWH